MGRTGSETRYSAREAAKRFVRSRDIGRSINEGAFLRGYHQRKALVIELPLLQEQKDLGMLVGSDVNSPGEKEIGG